MTFEGLKSYWLYLLRGALVILTGGALAFASTAQAKASKTPITRKVSSVTGAPRTVCTATINSKEEIAEFKRALQPQGFIFKELVPQGDENPWGWFQKACDSGIQCDIIVISGHFANGFSGRPNTFTSIETMKAGRCSNQCDGILAHPKEVFLFGCNTLGTKGQDLRTPDQYREALAHIGYDDQAIAQAVAVKYSPLGDSSREDIQQVFAGVPIIHGFDATAPLGRQIKGAVREYFQNSRNYMEKIDRLESAKLNGRLSKNNQFVTNLDPVWQQSLAGTNRRSCSGAAEMDRFTCMIGDAEISNISKLRSVRLELAGSGALRHLITIGNYLLELQDEMTNDERSEFLRVLKSPVREQLISLVPKFKDAPVVKAEFVRILKLWNNDPEVGRLLVKELNEPELDVKQSAIFALHGTTDPGTIKELYDLGTKDPESYRRSDGLQALRDCKDPLAHQAFLIGLKDSEYEVNIEAINGLYGTTDLAEQKVLLALAQNKKAPSWATRSEAVKALDQARDPAIIRALVVLLDDKERMVAFEASAILREIQDPTVQKALVHYHKIHPDY